MTPSQSRQVDQELVEQFDAILRHIGADPRDVTGKLVREMMHTAVKLASDGADSGELKLTSRSLKEMRYALKVFRAYRQVRKVTIFGSARTAEDHPDYQAAVAFSKKMAAEGWMVITGAGGGIMRAGHGGAGRKASFGVAIRLPFETTANEYILDDPKLIVFRYFFTRKLMFASQASAVVLFPGGFGTQDECFEILTLIQTGKSPLVPIVMVDSGENDYWGQWRRFVCENLLAHGWINEEDLNLFTVVRDPLDAAAEVLGFFRNYHSQRYVRDDLVIRMNRPLKPEQVEALNAEFHSLAKDGVIAQGSALRGEDHHRELPRLRLHSTRRDFGRLRLMINRINDFDRQNHPGPVAPAASPESSLDEGVGAEV